MYLKQSYTIKLQKAESVLFFQKTCVWDMGISNSSLVKTTHSSHVLFQVLSRWQTQRVAVCLAWHQMICHSQFSCVVPGAKSVVDSACRCMFGLAPDDMSLLFFLMYIKAAGGFDIFIQPMEFTGGECRVKVSAGSRLVQGQGQFVCDRVYAQSFYQFYRFLY